MPAPALTALSSSAANSTTRMISIFFISPTNAALDESPPVSVFLLFPMNPQMIPVR